MMDLSAKHACPLYLCPIDSGTTIAGTTITRLVVSSANGWPMGISPMMETSTTR